MLFVIAFPFKPHGAGFPLTGVAFEIGHFPIHYLFLPLGYLLQLGEGKVVRLFAVVSDRFIGGVQQQ
jgi:hypothetical protein